MPTYRVEVRTHQGPDRYSFTIDDDRSLTPQVHHILEELQQRGLVLRGGPGDELVLLWDGKRLDGRKTPRQLGLDPSRAIELSMQRRTRVARKSKPKRVGEPVRRFVPGGTYSLVVLAGISGLGAWVVSGLLVSMLTPIFGYRFGDAASAAVLGACLGGATWGWLARLHRSRAGRALLIGLLGGGVVGLVIGGAFVLALNGSGRSAVSPGALTFRLLSWAILGACLGLASGLGAARIEGRPRAGRLGVSTLSGLAFGTLAGALLVLPGPYPAWHAGAFVLLGLGIGIGLSLARLRPALGVVELERSDGRTVRRWLAAEWPMVPGDSIALHDVGAGGRAGGTAAIRTTSAGARIESLRADTGSTTPRVNGESIRGSLDLLNGDRIEIGRSLYRYRILPRRRR